MKGSNVLPPHGAWVTEAKPFMVSSSPPMAICYTSTSKCPFMAVPKYKTCLSLGLVLGLVLGLGLR